MDLLDLLYLLELQLEVVTLVLLLQQVVLQIPQLVVLQVVLQEH